MTAIVRTWDSEWGRRASMKRAGRNRCKANGHPTTSEMDYKPHEMEFMKAMEAFKLRTGRKFPTWREILGVVEGLGYCRPAIDPPEGCTAA